MDIVGRWLDIFTALWTNVSWQFVSVVVDQQHNHSNVILTFGLQTDSTAGASGWGWKWQLNFFISTNNQRHFLFLHHNTLIHNSGFSTSLMILFNHRKRCQSCQNKSNDVQVTTVWTEHYISTKGPSLGSRWCPDHLQERCLLRANTQATTLFPASCCPHPSYAHTAPKHHSVCSNEAPKEHWRHNLVFLSICSTILRIILYSFLLLSIISDFGVTVPV